MNNFRKIIRGSPRVATLTLSLAFATGCASTPSSSAKSSPAAASPPGEIVVGSGTDDQRRVISSSDQHMYDAERGISPDSPTPADAPGQMP